MAEQESNGALEGASFEDAIRTHLIENRKNLVAQAVGSAIEKMAESMKWNALQVAQKQMTEFFEKEVGPQVATYLAANREAIIAQVIATMKTVIDDGLKKQAADWIKEMESPYSRAGVVSKMFGGKGY